MSEYNNSTVQGGACSYATLSHYNNRSSGSMSSPAVPRTTVSGMYIVPSYGAPGYSALTHGAAPSCSGFFNITSAYGKNASNCNTQYVQKLCQ